MKPFETAIDRARMLYRIPTAPARNRVLELCVTHDSLLRDYTWPGETKTSCRLFLGTECEVNAGQDRADALKPLPYPDNAFDLVILNQVLDDLLGGARLSGVTFNPQQFLVNLLPHVAPGGLIAGTINNRTSPKIAWRRWIGQTDVTAHYTLRGCRNLMRSSGLQQVRVFNLLPNSAAPQKLVDIDPIVSRFAFRQELQARREELSLLAYQTRNALLHLGLFPYLEESIFFYGYKAC